MVAYSNSSAKVDTGINNMYYKKKRAGDIFQMNSHNFQITE